MIPNTLNFIWIGSKPSEGTVSSVGSFAKLNLEYLVYLWIDERFLSAAELTLLKNQAFENMFEIKYLNDIFSLKEFQNRFPVVEKMLEYELSRRAAQAATQEIPFNYFVPVSDIARLWILNIHGGHYLDDDLMPINNTAAFSDDLMPINNTAAFPKDININFGVNPGNQEGLIASNSILSAPKDSERLQYYITLVEQNWNYLISAVEGYENFLGKPFIEKERINNSAHVQNYRAFVGVISGPLLLQRVIEGDTKNVLNSLEKYAAEKDSKKILQALGANCWESLKCCGYRAPEKVASPLALKIRTVNWGRYRYVPSQSLQPPPKRSLFSFLDHPQYTNYPIKLLEPSKSAKDAHPLLEDKPSRKCKN